MDDPVRIIRGLCWLCGQRLPGDLIGSSKGASVVKRERERASFYKLTITRQGAKTNLLNFLRKWATCRRAFYKLAPIRTTPAMPIREHIIGIDIAEAMLTPS